LLIIEEIEQNYSFIKKEHQVVKTTRSKAKMSYKKAQEQDNMKNSVLKGGNC